jgi:hypothetical protein
LARSVEFFHVPTRRNFPAMCRNISKGGMLMYIPASTPVQPGQAVRLHVTGLSLPAVADLAAQPIDATILRVDRQSLLADGQLSTAVRFCGTST